MNAPDRMGPVRPLLKWAGNKYRLGQVIADTIGRVEGPYVEPFCGSLGSLLALRERRVLDRATSILLVDACAPLVDLHRVTQASPELLTSLLDALPSSGVTREIYDEIRRQFREGGTAADQAARLVWLNKYGFNGLYRTSAKGLYNVPWGQVAAVALPDRLHIETVSARLRGAEIRRGDAASTLATVGAGATVYCDPPYLPLRPGHDFTAYSAPFGYAKHVELCVAARGAADRGARVFVSNHDTPEIRELYEQHGARVVWADAVRRSISKSGNRAPASELIVQFEGR